MNPHALFPAGEFARILDSVKRLDDKGRLYELCFDADYYPLEPMLDKMMAASCSTFVTPDLKGGFIMARNYDYSHFRYADELDGQLTALDMVVRCKNPNAKYESIGMADAYWLDPVHGTAFEGFFDDGRSDISAAAILPFICVDGINSRGLTVSIMALNTENNWEEIEYTDPESLDRLAKKKALILTESGQLPDRLSTRARKDSLAINTADRRTWKNNKAYGVKQDDPGKTPMYHTVMMRRMLDQCADVDEALKLARDTNVRTLLPCSDYHILVADAKGQYALLEWVDNKLNIVDTPCSTNFYLSREDRFGSGYERFDTIAMAYKRFPKGMTIERAKAYLQLAAQNRNEGTDPGLTLWSVIYDMQGLTMDLWIDMDYYHCRSFKL